MLKTNLVVLLAVLQIGGAFVPPMSALVPYANTVKIPSKGEKVFRPSGKNVVTVPWFPMSQKDLDLIGDTTLDAGVELDSDHPGFLDQEYRNRRRIIIDTAKQFKHGQNLPRIAYTPKETETWGHVYTALKAKLSKHAVTPFNEILSELEGIGLYGDKVIPQIGDVSAYLKDKTGFTLRPVGGLLTARDFLNGLAFNVFHSTQYIRHHSKPLYTPEPDIVHELIGHAPMLAEPDFAALSQKIGLASLAATDLEIERLATAYWFSVEFGLCMENGKRKAYGAGLLSSIGELEYACTGGRMSFGGKRPEYRKWDPVAASVQKYPITEYQPLYYIADSLSDAEAQIASFGELISKKRPFSADYDEKSGCIKTTPGILRLAKNKTQSQ